MSRNSFNPNANYNIFQSRTGYPRYALNQGLRPGNFRNSRVSVFPTNTFINNYGGFNSRNWYDCGCCDCGSNDSTPKWMNWLMGAGLVSQCLGGIFSLFGNKDKTDRTDNTADIAALQARATGIAKCYTTEKPFVDTDGSIRIKIDGEVKKFNNIEEMESALSEAQKPKKTVTEPEPNKDRTTAADGKGGSGSTPIIGSDFNNFNWTDLKINKLNDTKTSPIRLANNTSTVCSNEMGTYVNAPKTIEIKDGDTLLYKFTLNDSVDGIIGWNPEYTCVYNGTDLDADKQQEYFLTTDGEFKQTTDMQKGWGVGLGTDTTTQQAARQSGGGSKVTNDAPTNTDVLDPNSAAWQYFNENSYDTLTNNNGRKTYSIKINNVEVTANSLQELYTEAIDVEKRQKQIMNKPSHSAYNSRRAVKFGNSNNVIYKAPGANVDMDSDAIFVIGGVKYNVGWNGHESDYGSLKIEDCIKSGTLNSCKGLIGKKFKAKGHPLDGKVIQESNGIIGIMWAGKLVSLDDIMNGTNPLTISQNREV